MSLNKAEGKKLREDQSGLKSTEDIDDAEKKENNKKNSYDDMVQQMADEIYPKENEQMHNVGQMLDGLGGQIKISSDTHPMKRAASKTKNINKKKNRSMRLENSNDKNGGGGSQSFMNDSEMLFDGNFNGAYKEFSHMNNGLHDKQNSINHSKYHKERYGGMNVNNAYQHAHHQNQQYPYNQHYLNYPSNYNQNGYNNHYDYDPYYYAKSPNPHTHAKNGMNGHTYPNGNNGKAYYMNDPMHHQYQNQYMQSQYQDYFYPPPNQNMNKDYNMNHDYNQDYYNYYNGGYGKKYNGSNGMNGNNGMNGINKINYFQKNMIHSYVYQNGLRDGEYYNEQNIEINAYQKNGYNGYQEEANSMNSSFHNQGKGKWKNRYQNQQGYQNQNTYNASQDIGSSPSRKNQCPSH